jgi:hypothetical protein
MIKIEKDIPIPNKIIVIKTYGITGGLRQLQIGESFVIPWVKSKPNTLSVFAKRIKIKIVTRRIDDETIRIWRIE